MMSGGGGSEKQTIKNDPWAGQQPYLGKLFKRADQLYNAGPIPYYPGQANAGISPETETALQMQAQRGLDGSPLNKASGQYISDILAGKYLSQTAPGWDSVVNRARNAADSTYAGAGRYGSGAHDTAVADSIGALAYQNYANQLGRMDMAAQFAPTLAQQDYTDIAAIGQAGDRRQIELQKQIDADKARFDYQQMAPYQNLGMYQDFIQGQYGGTQTSTAPSNQPPLWQSILGTGLGIAGAAGGLGWMPFA
ncbi:MAG: hypothetical protein A4E20_04800 [Nitrospira sp. SG-bin2]|uniref:hypothetical protein n=1 Tax=Nitrospira cf. moscoviensis SBR1015 TaxID=96242 RepID=UPI000A0C9E6A|nr:hypothetical protein [Nitrospira cf. moscoviensis SBR1015]OQW38096.1 MAG: hypothetical protein A4E20_04800 [Nitrospira sp. SG-bin2]